MRGTRSEHVSWHCRVGIIPAYAGNTTSRTSSRTLSGDHPRVCGEHVESQTGNLRKAGSSPRMRGTLSDRNDMYLMKGIIPAYAGNTQTACHAPDTIWDHPRVCGEHYGRYSLPTASVGSSPRMRGTLSLFESALSMAGIIPAYAGNTLRD